MSGCVHGFCSSPHMAAPPYTAAQISLTHSGDPSACDSGLTMCIVCVLKRCSTSRGGLTVQQRSRAVRPHAFKITFNGFVSWRRLPEGFVRAPVWELTRGMWFSTALACSWCNAWHIAETLDARWSRLVGVAIDTLQTSSSFYLTG